MPKHNRRVIVCDDALWAWFQLWDIEHGITGYRNRQTFSATLGAMKEILDLLEGVES